VVVGVDIGVLVVWVVIVMVVVIVEAVLIVVIVVTVVVVGRANTLFRQCFMVCAVSSFFKSSRWPVSQSMKPGSPTRAIQSPDLWPQTTSRYGKIVSLCEYRELAWRTFTPKGSMTCHSEIFSPSIVEPVRLITSLLSGPETSKPEPAFQGNARTTMPTVATAAVTPRTASHR